MAKSIKDRLLTLGAAAVVGLSAIPLSNIAVSADEVTLTPTGDNGKATLHIPTEGVHHWNVDPSVLSDEHGLLQKIDYENIRVQEENFGNQVLYVNVDLAGYDTYVLPSTLPPSGHNEEESGTLGTNILWTFYRRRFLRMHSCAEGDGRGETAG